MDIGDPNNLSRLLAWRDGGPSVEAVTVDDRATLDAMRRVRDASGYILCPHTAVGWKAAEDLLARDGAKLDDVIVFGLDLYIKSLAESAAAEKDQVLVHS